MNGIKLLSYLFLFVCNVAYFQATAQNGSNDPSFNPSDMGLNNGGGFNSSVNSIVTLPNGKILVGGSFTSFRDRHFGNILRFDADYNIDTSFHTGTGFSKHTGASAIYCISLQSDGKIIVAGQYDSYDGKEANNLIRLNADGSMDSTFKIGTGCNNRVLAILVTHENKIFVGGDFTVFNGDSLNRLVRLNNNGDRDTSFKIGFGFDGTVRALALQNNRIIVGGYFWRYNDTTTGGVATNVQGYLIGLNQNGTVDSSFQKAYGLAGAVLTLHVMPDHKILVGGKFYGSFSHFVRLNPNGSLDMSFHLPTSGSYATYVAAILPLNDKIYIGGYFPLTSGMGNLRTLIRIDTSGFIDSTFKAPQDFQNPINALVFKDTELLAGGANATVVFDYFARITLKGERIDFSDPGTGFNNTVHCMKKDARGLIVVGGDFTYYDSKKAQRLVRIDEDGNRDPSFDTEDGFDGSVYTITIQSDGKLIIGGNFQRYKHYNSQYIVRLNKDGSLDTSFHAPFINAAVFSIMIQGEKILVGCNSSSGVRRLNFDGSQDMSFHLGSLYCLDYGPPYVKCLSLQNNGKILVGGNFDRYNWIERHNIARLNADGTLDETFNDGPEHPGSYNCATFRGVDKAIYNLTVSYDSSIYIGGDFTYASWTRKNRILRYDVNGNIDNHFETGYDGTNGIIKSILPLVDTYVMIGGEFTKFYGTSSPGLISIDCTGRIDPAFNVGTGFNGSVNCLIPLDNEKVLVAGSFTSLNGKGRNRIARINYIPHAPDIQEISNTQVQHLFMNPNPSSGIVKVEFSADRRSTATITVTDLAGVNVSTIQEKTEQGTNSFELDLSAMSAGIYFIELRGRDFCEVRKIIIQ